MDITEASSRREIEQLKQLLKEREREHSEELDKTRERYRASLKETEDSQQRTIENVRKASTDDVERLQSQYRKGADEARDSFERNIQEERRAAYDRHGKLAREALLDRARERDSLRDELENMHRANRKIADSARERENEQAKQNRAIFESNRRELDNYLIGTRATQDRAHEDALNKTAAETRDKIDHNIRVNGEEMAKLKADHDIHSNKLVKEAETDRNNLVAAHQLREKQLLDAKLDAEHRAGREIDGIIKEYRSRANETVQKLSEDNRFALARKEQQYTADVARTNQDGAAKAYEMANQFRQSADEYKQKLEQEQNRDRLRRELDERRHAHETFLNNDIVQKRASVAQSETQEKYREQLVDLDDRYRKNQERFMGEAKNRMDELSANAASDQADLRRRNEIDQTQQTAQRKRYNELLAKNFQERFENLDGLRQRQLEGQRDEYTNQLREVRANGERQLTTTNRDSQAKLYKLQQLLTSKIDELETQRQSDREEISEAHTRQAQRLADQYRKSLTKTQQSHEEATEELRSENMMVRARIQSDADHDMRMQLLDLKSKNRALANGWEAKFAQIKDEHTEELDKLKAENGKMLRELLRKTRQEIEDERKNHAKELALKDMQTKEKLKVQEEGFRDQIERLRRTNELTIKKSTERA